MRLRALQEPGDDPADEGAGECQQRHREEKRDPDRHARDGRHAAIMGPQSVKPQDDEARLKSGKAVAAALMLGGVLLIAAALFFWVVIERACLPAQTLSGPLRGRTDERGKVASGSSPDNSDRRGGARPRPRHGGSFCRPFVGADGYRRT